MTRTSLKAATAVAALATSRSSLIILAATLVVGTVSSFSASAAVRGYHRTAGHFSNAAVTRSRPAMVYGGTLRLGSTKYNPAPGLGSKFPAKVTFPSALTVTAVPGLKPINIGSKLTPIKMPASGGMKVTQVPGLKPINIGSKLTPIKMPAPGGDKVTPVPGLKPIDIGSKLTPKTTLPTGTIPPSAPKTPSPPANPSSMKGPTNTGSYPVNGAFVRPWDSPPTNVAAATLPTKVPGIAAIDCRGRTEDGGYLTWQRAFNANGQPQLLCVRVFN